MGYLLKAEVKKIYENEQRKIIKKSQEQKKINKHLIKCIYPGSN